jgi:hypothetical protein
MTPSRWLWAAAVLLYAVFFLWYGGVRGPLTPQEVERYLGLLARQQGVDARQLEWFRRFAETDDGREFFILNLGALRERPLEAPARREDESSEQVLARYTAYFIPRLFPRAGHPVMAGSPIVPIEQWGTPEEPWDSLVVIRHRSRRDLLEMVTAPGMEGTHLYKVAALEKTVALSFDPSLVAVGARVWVALALGAAAGIGHAVLATRGRRLAPTDKRMSRTA